MPTKPDNPLARLADLATQRKEIDIEIENLVGELRRVRGRDYWSRPTATWRDIAYALDVTPQAAHKRFRHVDE